MDDLDLAGARANGARRLAWLAGEMGCVDRSCVAAVDFDGHDVAADGLTYGNYIENMSMIRAIFTATKSMRGKSLPMKMYSQEVS